MNLRPPADNSAAARLDSAPMLDDRVRAVLRRLEDEDRREREAGLPPRERSRQIPPETGKFLYSICAPQTEMEVIGLGRVVIGSPATLQ